MTLNYVIIKHSYFVFGGHYFWKSKMVIHHLDS